MLNSGNNENIKVLYPIEFLNKLEFNGLPSHELILKGQSLKKVSNDLFKCSFHISCSALDLQKFQV